MTVFLDTSVVLRKLFRQPGASPSWSQWSRVYASELLQLECCRAFDRMRLQGQLDDRHRALVQEEYLQLCQGIGFVGLLPDIVARAAEPFPTVLGSLDALHLATALALRERLKAPLRVATHDLQMRHAAISLGFEVE